MGRIRSAVGGMKRSNVPTRFVFERILHYLAQNETMEHNELERIPFHSTRDRGWDEAMAIYEHSFPPAERWTADGYARALSDPLFEADGIWLEGRLAGLLFYWQCPDSLYLEHLAVSPAMRGRDLGSTVLRAFCRDAGRVILEIDPPEDEISIRRQGFYERNGFVTNPYAYVHPSFRRPFQPHRLVLMSYPGPIDWQEALDFEAFVRREVLKYSDHVR